MPWHREWQEGLALLMLLVTGALAGAASSPSPVPQAWPAAARLRTFGRPVSVALAPTPP